MPTGARAGSRQLRSYVPDQPLIGEKTASKKPGKYRRLAEDERVKEMGIVDSPGHRAYRGNHVSHRAKGLKGSWAIGATFDTVHESRDTCLSGKSVKIGRHVSSRVYQHCRSDIIVFTGARLAS